MNKLLLLWIFNQEYDKPCHNPAVFFSEAIDNKNKTVPENFPWFDTESLTNSTSEKARVITLQLLQGAARICCTSQRRNQGSEGESTGQARQLNIKNRVGLVSDHKQGQSHRTPDNPLGMRQAWSQARKSARVIRSGSLEFTASHSCSTAQAWVWA